MYNQENTVEHSFFVQSLDISSRNGTLCIRANGKNHAGKNSVESRPIFFEIAPVRFNQEKGQEPFHNLKCCGKIDIDTIKECSNQVFCCNFFYNILLGEQQLTVICKQNKEGKKFLFLINTKEWRSNLCMKLNERQILACAGLLFDENISYVALSGKAGTGKTLLALLAGLQQIAEYDTKYSNFQRIRVFRPLVTTGEDLGTLPGDANKKFAPWVPPIEHNINVISQLSSKRKKINPFADELLVVEPISWLRGQTFDHEFIIIDDAQNLSCDDIKTICSRLGQGSKMVFTGDHTQIDNHKLTPVNNGFVHLIQCARGQPFFGHIEFTKCERHADIEALLDLL